MALLSLKLLNRTALAGTCALLVLVSVACSSSSSDDSDVRSAGGSGNAGSAGKSSSSGGASGGNHAGGGVASGSGGSGAGGTGGSSSAGGSGANGGQSSGAGSGGSSAGGTSAGGSNVGGTSAGGSGGRGHGGRGGASSGGSSTGGSSTGGSGGSSTGTGNSGTIVPLYTDPGDQSWTAIMTAKKAHPTVDVVAIVNPDNGPGSKVDSSYTKGIDALIAAGVVPIGYVSTQYTDRGEPAVKAFIDSWSSFYPHLQGIFFDEQSDNASDAPFYADVGAYAKGKGLNLTVGNPGTAVPSAFLTALDVMLIYESKGLPKASSLAGDAANRTHFGVIPYGASYDATFVAAAKGGVRYIYATSDDLPNPWDSLTPYFDQLLGDLE